MPRQRSKIVACDTTVTPEHTQRKKGGYRWSFLSRFTRTKRQAASIEALAGIGGSEQEQRAATLLQKLERGRSSRKGKESKAIETPSLDETYTDTLKASGLKASESACVACERTGDNKPCVKCRQAQHHREKHQAAGNQITESATTSKRDESKEPGISGIGDSEQEQRAATQLQKLERGRKARKKYKSDKKARRQRPADIGDSKEEQRAATQLQKLERGRRVRKDYNEGVQARKAREGKPKGARRVAFVKGMCGWL